MSLVVLGNTEGLFTQSYGKYIALGLNLRAEFLVFRVRFDPTISTKYHIHSKGGLVWC